MVLKGKVNNIEDGMVSSLRAMHVATARFNMHNDNVSGFDKIGYQRQEAVISSFTEFLGIKGLAQTTNDEVGRIAVSDNPLDVAITEKGYFQHLTNEGIKLSRDGRFQINKNGDLLTLSNDKVLSTAGSPIKLPFLPEDIKDIKIDNNGKISMYNKTTNEMEYVDTISVVSSNNVAVVNPQLKQGYKEFSNVSLQEEFINIFPISKNFDANRQMFIIQSNNLSKVISEIGKA